MRSEPSQLLKVNTAPDVHRARRKDCACECTVSCKSPLSVQMSTNVFEIHMFLSKTHIVSKLKVSWKTPLRLFSFLFFRMYSLKNIIMANSAEVYSPSATYYLWHVVQYLVSVIDWSVIVWDGALHFFPKWAIWHWNSCCCVFMVSAYYWKTTCTLQGGCSLGLTLSSLSAVEQFPNQGLIRGGSWASPLLMINNSSYIVKPVESLMGRIGGVLGGSAANELTAMNGGSWIFPLKQLQQLPKGHSWTVRYLIWLCGRLFS